MRDRVNLPEVKPHAIEKYRVLERILALFSTGMKKLWDCRVYVDLFAGAGEAQVKGDGVVRTSSGLALGVRDPFDRYILVEKVPDYCAHLGGLVAAARVADARIMNGDCNAMVPDILKAMPRPTSARKVLSLCLVDPFNVRLLDFATIRALAQYRMDFLVLVPTGMDVHRNEKAYWEAEDDPVARFTGARDWRDRWDKEPDYERFGQFFLDEMDRSMAALGFIKNERGDAHPIIGTEKNALLYHLAYYTRHPRGIDFWQKSKRDMQGRLFS